MVFLTGKMYKPDIQNKMNPDLFFFVLVKGRRGKGVSWALVILGSTNTSQGEEII